MQNNDPEFLVHQDDVIRRSIRHTKRHNYSQFDESDDESGIDHKSGDEECDNGFNNQIELGRYQDAQLCLFGDSSHFGTSEKDMKKQKLISFVWNYLERTYKNGKTLD